ncbi:hypothetical protein DFH08DRAFT_817630 [Mycena albidolilacea]|uniref:Uncharacterized protein n=1 Tax=Mycena albidolilacea TaxID=1033008 RepID=A0AAD6ZIA8_9AGAR|nr:hypothetical protein DFH08DRAFT_817630 [Mycena albidolilacea]
MTAKIPIDIDRPRDAEFARNYVQKSLSNETTGFTRTPPITQWSLRFISAQNPSEKHLDTKYPEDLSLLRRPRPAACALPPPIDGPSGPAAQKFGTEPAQPLRLRRCELLARAPDAQQAEEACGGAHCAAAAALPSKFRFHFVQERRRLTQRRLGAVQAVRSCEALPSTYLYHSANNNYSGYAASPRRLDVELRELSGEVEFAPTQFAAGKEEEPEEQEIDDSGIFLAEEFVPARSSTPPPSSPSSAVYSSSPQRTAGLARTPTARTYPIAARARARVRPGSPFPLSRSLSLSASASAAASAAGAAMQGDYVR